MSKRLILVGKYYIIEPLGILYLLGIAKRLGWEAKVVLIKDFDFEPLFREVDEFRPDLVGFSIWTGYHVKTFHACDTLLASGIPVIIGGPHATYFTEECRCHATWVIKAEGFRNFRKILEGELSPGIYFDIERMAEGFPVPDRELVYQEYPELAASLIKSIFCSIGCPFHCSYCYAPAYNEMYGGFALNLRPIDEIIDEALKIKERWPLSMIYFQDDIFGFNIPWLKDFVQAWRTRVGVAWHCQIRLELTRDIRRLELFREGGCTGITLAIESGNDFLRRFVLLRPMPDELIVEGIQKIQNLGFTLRTEQILAVPFSDIETDLETLELNTRLNPEMAWTSILAPYGGTNMGLIASEFGFYKGNNDDLSETFFDRSVLRHVRGGRRAIEAIVRALAKNIVDNPLLRMGVKEKNEMQAEIFVKDEDGLFKESVGELEYLSEEENDRYCNQTVMLQRIFNWLSKVPKGAELGAKFVALEKEEWTWEKLGDLTRYHLRRCGVGEKMERGERELANLMGYAWDDLPQAIAVNPYYFCFFPSSHKFAEKLLKLNVFDMLPTECFDILGREARRWLFEHALYKVIPATPPLLKA